MKWLPIFLAAVVVGCVIVAKLTGLHDHGVLDDGRTIPVADLVKRSHDVIERRVVSVSGVYAQTNRYATKTHAMIREGADGAHVYCAQPVDAKGMTYGTKVVAEGTITFEEMTNILDGTTSGEIVLRDCKVRAI